MLHFIVRNVYKPACSAQYARLIYVSIVGMTLIACHTARPSGIKVVNDFDIQRFQGTWYEIARLNHAFEKGLTDVSAIYEQQSDGPINVINQGYDPLQKKWYTAHGTALFLDRPTIGALKISFFWPFYGGYYVVALDKQHYQWAMIAGPTHRYLWILSRERTLAAAITTQLVNQARLLNFPTEQLIFVQHHREK